MKQYNKTQWIGKEKSLERALLFNRLEDAIEKINLMSVQEYEDDVFYKSGSVVVFNGNVYQSLHTQKGVCPCKYKDSWTLLTDVDVINSIQQSIQSMTSRTDITRSSATSIAFPLLDSINGHYAIQGESEIINHITINDTMSVGDGGRLAGIAATDEHIYVLNYSNKTIYEYNIDTRNETGNTIRFSKMKAPRGFAIADNEFWVIDASRDSIVRHNFDGEEISSVHIGNFCPSPQDIEIVGDNVYVSCSSKKRIVKFNKQGVFKEIVCQLSLTTPKSGRPYGIKFHEGKWYIADYSKAKVFRYNNNWEYEAVHATFKRARCLTFADSKLLVTRDDTNKFEFLEPVYDSYSTVVSDEIGLLAGKGDTIVIGETTILVDDVIDDNTVSTLQNITPSSGTGDIKRQSQPGDRLTIVKLDPVVYALRTPL